MQELHLQLATAVAELTHELGRSPSVAEIARRADASVDDVIEAMEAGHAYRSSSLDAPLSGDDPTAQWARLGDPDDRFTGVDERNELDSLLRDLPERERAILVLRFYDGLTQGEIARRVGISQMHVSRLLSRTLDVLRRRVAEGERGA